MAEEFFPKPTELLVFGNEREALCNGTNAIIEAAGEKAVPLTAELTFFIQQPQLCCHRDWQQQLSLMFFCCSLHLERACLTLHINIFKALKVPKPDTVINTTPEEHAPRIRVLRTVVANYVQCAF